MAKYENAQEKKNKKLKIKDLDEFNYDWDNIVPLDRYVEPIVPSAVSPGLKIVGGTVAARGQFPYQVALIINNSGFCGGSILSNQWVLTAAHCVDTATSVQIIVGAHNPRTTVNEPTQVRLAANARTVHAQWNPNTIANDVALLRAASIPVGQSGISRVNLAAASAGTFAGSNGVISGWGRTSDASSAIATELRTVTVPVITNAVCQQTYGTSSVNAQHICTSGANGRGSCNGDSGGPLTVNGVQVGIVSFGTRLCAAGNPSVFARVSHFRSWISSNSGV
ncbi:hypothetical protein ABEB36_006854 [Hypothenemus hampei]|uniref:Peptidase S1 domain-containing protein n=1 Tax=Hypothenemus hampei TaxID=57062 RepID=A0ABD1ES02_HYPHA